MSFFSKEPNYIGIEITASSLRIVVIKKTKKTLSLLHIKEVPLTEELHFIKTLSKQGVIITALPQKQVMVRSFFLELKREKDIAKALDFQVEPHLPFPLEEAILQTKIEKNIDKKGFTITLFAVKKCTLQEHLEKYLSYQITPDCTTCAALSLAALSTLEIKESHSEKFMVNLGEEESSVVLVKEGKVIGQRTFSSQKDSPLHIQRALLSLEESHPQYKCSALLLFGRESHLLVKEIQALTGKTVHTMNTSSLSALTEEELRLFALPLGSALSQIENKKITFLQKEFAPVKRHRLLKKPLILTLLLTTLSTLALLIGGNQLILHTKETLHQKLESLSNFRGENSSSLIELKDAYDYRIYLEKLENTIKSSGQKYALEAIVPKVSDFMCWLSSSIEKEKSPLQDIVIESIHYELICRPTPLAQNEHYKVLVEIAFKATSPNVKEALEDFLSESARFIDDREDCTVTLFGKEGKATFVLKDKTHYG